MRVCLLGVSEAMPMNSYTHGYLNINDTRTTPTDMLISKRES